MTTSHSNAFGVDYASPQIILQSATQMIFLVPYFHNATLKFCCHQPLPRSATGFHATSDISFYSFPCCLYFASIKDHSIQSSIIVRWRIVGWGAK